MEIKGSKVDSHGCVEQPSGAVAYGDCIPSDADYEVCVGLLPLLISI